MSATAQFVPCRDGCGTEVEFPAGVTLHEAAEQLTAKGWVWLASVARWRCPACANRLNTVKAQLAADPTFADRLDPRSRGALPRNTAVTIVPPVNVAAHGGDTLDWGDT
jgi:hypothetical protein